MCPGCVPLDTCEVGRVTWEAGAALDGSTHCVQHTHTQKVRPPRAPPVTLPTSRVQRESHQRPSPMHFWGGEGSCVVGLRLWTANIYIYRLEIYRYIDI